MNDYPPPPHLPRGNPMLMSTLQQQQQPSPHHQQPPSSSSNPLNLPSSSRLPSASSNQRGLPSGLSSLSLPSSLQSTIGIPSSLSSRPPQSPSSLLHQHASLSSLRSNLPLSLPSSNSSLPSLPSNLPLPLHSPLFSNLPLSHPSFSSDLLLQGKNYGGGQGAGGYGLGGLSGGFNGLNLGGLDNGLGERREEREREGPRFGPSDFPSLSEVVEGKGGGNNNNQQSANSASSLPPPLSSQSGLNSGGDFAIANEEFPALSSARRPPGSSLQRGNSVSSGGGGFPYQANMQPPVSMRTQSNPQGGQGGGRQGPPPLQIGKPGGGSGSSAYSPLPSSAPSTPSSITSAASTSSSTSSSLSSSSYGLTGLLSVIRMTDPDLNTLALGTDLTTLGLNLSSTEVLYATFAFPASQSSPTTSHPADYVLPYCFPAVDTRILTDGGMQFLDEIVGRLSRGEKVLYGCYDVTTKTLCYRTGTLYFPPASPSSLLEFIAPEEAQRWSKSSGPYGGEWKDNEEDDEKRGRHRQISLRVTPNHRMFVQIGNELADKGRIEWESRTVDEDGKKRRVTKPFAQIAASDLLSACQCPSDVDCSHRLASMRFLTVAEGGIELQQPQHSAQRLRLQERLRLNDARFLTFLEIFGFWLRNGSMQYTANGDALDAVSFGQADCDWIRNQLCEIGLHTDEIRSCVNSNGKEEVSVIHPRWFSLFEEEFSVKDLQKLTPASTTRGLSVSEIENEGQSELRTEDDEEDEPMKLVKRFPQWMIMHLRRDDLRLIVRGLSRADKNWSNQNRRILTSDIQFRDQLIQILLHCGYSAHSRLLHSASTNGNKESVDVWFVEWNDTTDSAAQDSCWPTMRRQESINCHPYSADVDGTIWCVNVDHPDHLIIAQRAERHDGLVTKQSQPIIVGNCYYMQPPALKTSHLSKFTLETLFYIFYSMPRDTLQVYASKELYSREWRYHKELKLWLTRGRGQGGEGGGEEFMFFDVGSWETRIFRDGHLLQPHKFLTEEELGSI